MTDHKAAKEFAEGHMDEPEHCPECNLSSAYLELLEAAKVVHDCYGADEKYGAWAALRKILEAAE